MIVWMPLRWLHPLAPSRGAAVSVVHETQLDTYLPTYLTSLGSYVVVVFQLSNLSAQSDSDSSTHKYSTT